MASTVKTPIISTASLKAITPLPTPPPSIPKKNPRRGQQSVEALSVDSRTSAIHLPSGTAAVKEETGSRWPQPTHNSKPRRAHRGQGQPHSQPFLPPPALPLPEADDLTHLKENKHTSKSGTRRIRRNAIVPSHSTSYSSSGRADTATNGWSHKAVAGSRSSRRRAPQPGANVRTTYDCGSLGGPRSGSSIYSDRTNDSDLNRFLAQFPEISGQPSPPQEKTPHRRRTSVASSNASRQVRMNGIDDEDAKLIDAILKNPALVDLTTKTFQNLGGFPEITGRLKARGGFHARTDERGADVMEGHFGIDADYHVNPPHAGLQGGAGPVAIPRGVGGRAGASKKPKTSRNVRSGNTPAWTYGEGAIPSLGAF